MNLPARFSHAFAVCIAVVAVTSFGVGPAQAQSAYNVASQFNGTNGSFPIGLTPDGAGNFYGVTETGGFIPSNGLCAPDGCGTVFKLSPNSSGGYTRTVLHKFSGDHDGAYPLASVILDSAGNLYGTTFNGGLPSLGIVYELSPTSSGNWRESILWTFTGPDGGSPVSSLTFDSDGNLYGTAEVGGVHDVGVVFELSPTLSGAWSETVLYNFDRGSKGRYPMGGVTLGGIGTSVLLYGTASNGGNTAQSCGAAGCGVVYELSRNAFGELTETAIAAFVADRGNGPLGNLVFDPSGNLYGVTRYGGDVSGCSNLGCGVVYELSPDGGGDWSENLLRVFEPGPNDTGDFHGAEPLAGLAIDSSGNLYGTTLSGGTSGYGVVFKISVGTGQETVLHSFTGGTDGGKPYSPVVLEGTKIFGATSLGGVSSDCVQSPGCGVVFEISP
jgi:uncharacterized repeat protein (TIGR03803 family)